MRAALTKFPTTHQELLEISHGELLRIPASFAEYWEFLKVARYKADYSCQEIIAMSYETNAHSKIVTEIMFLLRQVFDSPGYAVHDPNRPVYIAAVQAVHNPDCSVVLEPSNLFEYQAGMNAETTPLVVVEVLSKTTRDYDHNEKLPHYKQISSLRQIIFLESTKRLVIVFERPNENTSWSTRELSQTGDAFMVQGQLLALDAIYRTVGL